MKRKQWVLGIMCILLGVIILMGDSSRTQAASQSDRNAYRAVFDATYYYNAYPDVAAACGTDEEALFNHFVSFGVYEGRSASAAFNPQAYRQRYTDLQEAFGNDMAAYCRHYVTFGRAEGRNAAADGQAAVQIKVTIQKKAAPAADDKTSAREDTKKSKTDEAEKSEPATTKESASEETVEESKDDSKTDEAVKSDSKEAEAEKNEPATTKESATEKVVEDNKDESKTSEAEKNEPVTTKESALEEDVKDSKDDSKPAKSESKSAEPAKSDSKAAEPAKDRTATTKESATEETVADSKDDSKPAEAAKTDKPEDTQTASVQEADTPSVQTGDAAAETAKTEESEQSEQNQTAQTIIGTYTTYYEADVSRAVNVELAAQRINGIVVAPDENFSFSNTILDRTTANGYVEGPIFVKGEKSTGIGGGVCQVSSTLYAAMVDAGLPATERHPHSLPVDYLPEGLDATIAGNYMDLKFTNTFSQPLLIQASAEGGKLVVTLTLQ